jgi:hypothetical protein
MKEKYRPSAAVMRCFGTLAAVAAIGLPIYAQVAKVPEKEPPARAASLPAAEARARAQLLHTTINGALQVIHRDFFRRNGSKVIPSKSLEDVFKVLQKENSTTVRWVAGEGTVMNTDNKPRNDFERQAIKAITGGDKEFESLEKGIFHFAGSITLQNECLKCHVPDRTSLEERFAALAVSIPLCTPAPEK